MTHAGANLEIDRRTVMPTSVALGPHFETFVRAGRRLLEDTEHRKQLELETLRAEIAAGRASGPAKPAEEIFDRLEAKCAATGKAR